MTYPSLDNLPKGLRTAAQELARGLASAGHQAWIVGGTPRDLVLDRTPKDVDLATDARPEQIAALFPRSTEVGKAFGTVVVATASGAIEVTTFRTESGYSDRRRPDQVRFARTLEEDARRRDFTCNALYLHPLDGTLRDPCQGLADLERGELRTVGEARDRFGEDGLRLLRMARFLALYALRAAAGLEEQARACAGALVGVSVERVTAELNKCFEGAGGMAALRILDRSGLLEPALPRWSKRVRARELAGGRWPERLAALEALPDPAGRCLAWAGLCYLEDAEADATELVREQRVSRAELTRVEAIWRVARSLAHVDGDAARSVRLRVMREPAFEEACALRLAFHASDAERLRIERLRAERVALSDADLHPKLWLAADDLTAHGVQPGPRFGLLLRDLEDAQLDGKVDDRASALTWLAARLAALD